MKFEIDRGVNAARFIAAACLSASSVAASSPPYSVVSKWTLGGEGGWDYVALDPAAARLFVTRGSRVDVVDTGNGKIIGTIPGTMGIHGVTFAPELNRGFTSNGKSNTVTVFAMDSLKIVKEIAVTGQKPDAIFYDGKHRRVFTLNGNSHNATVIDAASLGAVATIALPGPPEFIAQGSNGDLFVNLETDNGRISVIDTGTLTLKAAWDLSGCASPTGLAIDAGNHRLFSVCQNRVMAVTDSESGKPVARVPIGAGPDACIFDAKTGLIFSSNGEDGTLTVVHEDDRDHFTVLQTVRTQKSARTMALDPKTHTIYLVGANIDQRQPLAQGQHRRPMMPGSFVVIVAAPKPVN
jgi:DNA-binding beta-propeller fold protein YncE